MDFNVNIQKFYFVFQGWTYIEELSETNEQYVCHQANIVVQAVSKQLTRAQLHFEKKHYADAATSAVAAAFVEWAFYGMIAGNVYKVPTNAEGMTECATILTNQIMYSVHAGQEITESAMILSRSFTHALQEFLSNMTNTPTHTIDANSQYNYLYALHATP